MLWIVIKKICNMFFFVHFQTFFSNFSREITEKALKWTKKVEKRLKKGFDQLLSARITQKLVEIHNICGLMHHVIVWEVGGSTPGEPE